MGGLSPSKGAPGKRDPLPVQPLVGKLCPCQGWMRWEGKFSRKLFSPSDLLPAPFSPSSRPALWMRLLKQKQRRTDSSFPLLPGASFLLRGNGTKRWVPTLGKGSRGRKMRENDSFYANLIWTQSFIPLGWWEIELWSVLWTLPLWGGWDYSH